MIQRYNLKSFGAALTLVFLLFNCGHREKGQSQPDRDIVSGSLEMSASDEALVEAFNWAKDKALSFAHDGSDPVGYWYEAALPNREAFCMRDVSHQAIGAEILGLGRHNYNMLLKFAQNISKEKDFCSFWEINRYDRPAPVDYENDQDFWYNLPANFDVIYNAWRVYNWTRNADYLENPDFKKFYELSLNEYVDHWDLGYDEVTERDRSTHVREGETRFGNKRGIPTYNEGGRGETILGIDMTASLAAAFNAYAEMLERSGDPITAANFAEKAKRERKFLDDFWWDEEKQAYRSIWYADRTFDYFMVGDDQAYLHYLFYFDVLSEPEKVAALIETYAANFDKLIVELKSYLPVIFYENGHTDMATKMVIDLCSPENKRRDYPENSFTIMEHITRGLMGVNVHAATNTVSTISRLEEKEDWVEMKNISLLSNKVSVKHFGKNKTIVANLDGPVVNWKVQIPGRHDFLFVNGDKVNCKPGADHGRPCSWILLELKEGEEALVSVER